MKETTNCVGAHLRFYMFLRNKKSGWKHEKLLLICVGYLDLKEITMK
jgi:hypothetical protein